MVDLQGLALLQFLFVVLLTLSFPLFFFLPFHMQVPEEKDKLGHRNNDIPWCTSKSETKGIAREWHGASYHLRADWETP